MLTLLSSLFLLTPLITAQSLTSSKRGLCYITQNNPDVDNLWYGEDGYNSDLTWYYNYGAEPVSDFNGKLEFVPMLFSTPASGTNGTFYSTVKGLIDGGMNITYVLGFNEPDGCADGGSCIPAETAAEVWINEIEPLKDLGVKLGAPAVTGADTGFTWLQQFFTYCAGNCSASFIPIHWYGDFAGLASHMGQVNGTYENMTMWVTEYAYPDVSLEDSQQFYNESASYFDRLAFVERYSYFGAFRSSVSNVGPNVAMLTQKGELTDIGAWYLGDAATGNIPKGGAAQLAMSASWAIGLVAAICFLLI